jgi:hypothetical protein
MKAGSNGTACVAGHAYTQCDWGDLIVGTKEQLQSLGLGVGCPFPGEAGGPRRHMNARDPRGYPVTIAEQRADGRYAVYLKFPDWPARPPWQGDWQPVYAGVKRRDCLRADEFLGAAPDLVAAGLVQPGHFPGLPGMRKMRVSVLADGTLPHGAPTANYRGAMAEPGARTVERRGSAYVVNVVPSPEEVERRLAAHDLAEADWRNKVRALPRPAMLQPGRLGRQLVARPRPVLAQPAPLFDEAPTAPEKRRAYEKHVFDSLKDLVDFTQTSAY